MAKKGREVTDEAELMEKLGVKSPEAPGGGPVATEVVPKEPEVKAEEPVQEEEDTSREELKLEEKEVSSTQNEDGTLKEEEVQRRNWQSEADAAKSRAERLQSELEQQKQLNQQIQSTLTPFLMKYGGDNEPKAPVEAKEPEADFIVDGYFDAQKYAAWQRKHDEWLLDQSEKRSMNGFKRQQQQQTANQQLMEVIKEFPEYLNPITGEPDIKRLENDLQGFTGNKSMIDIVREMKGKTPKAAVEPLKQEASISAIERNASRPQSAASAPEEEPEKKELPAGVKQMIKTFGKFELPPDFEGLEE